ncbi:alpha/beta fold hydrolase [Aldersonia kunmingensis]|uniref:alpha/beta fold hydrolase n=1 Tax=Aldersonia kunmingensis TaxID=408066 RepID=UPI00082F9CBB|nr:alpha/beta fold hydrolase [Aldersonia kunmingensis]
MELTTASLAAPLHRIVATAQNGLEVLRFGGLDTGLNSSPYELVEHRPMYRLRRYFPDAAPGTRPPVVMVPPMMLAADVYDVTRDKGAAGVLYDQGVELWVVDFGSPASDEGGWDRTLADHVVAINDAVDCVHKITGRNVHLGGYSQGGMFAYQAAASRHTKNLASVITFGSPVDIIANLPFGVPRGVATRGADFMADHVFSRLAITDWMARTGFQLMDPVKTVKARFDFMRQLHDREALLHREAQRRFLEREGWLPWAGPAIVELLKQFVVHNRMMSGGFTINDQLVSLADITCPILAFVGEVDDIGQPRAVRGIREAAARAEVYESLLNAGHFGLVVGSTAATQTWPSVAEWVRWREGMGELPEQIHEMAYRNTREERDSTITAGLRVAKTAAAAVSVGADVGKGIAGLAGGVLRGTADLTGEASRALPRLFRLGQIQPRTRISFASMLAEQAKRAPSGVCFLFEDRAHSNQAVADRIDNVVRGLIDCGVRPAQHVGVLMETRPSGLAATAALSRLGAVAVLLPPGSDLAAATQLTGISMIITDPENLELAASVAENVLVLGGGNERGLSIPTSDRVIDLEQIDPGKVYVPGWYRPNPGLARDLAFVLVSGSGAHMAAKYVTNYRWALSAFGTASSANLDSTDTVYCLAPLHHSSGLLVSIGGAIAGGARIALSRSLDIDPALFVEEVHRYGVTVVTYTWTMMRDIIDSESSRLERGHPVRLFIGSGMPVGLWERTTERFAPARVLEFYASTEGDVVLANVGGTKIGCKGRPVPGTAAVELAAYDPITGKLIQDANGFMRRCEDDEVGLLLGKASNDAPLPPGGMAGVFKAGDAWVPTENLFWRDSDGDYWLVDARETVIKSPRGPVYTQPIVDVLNELPQVDLAVAYGVGPDDRELAIAAITVRKGAAVDAELVTEALRGLIPAQRPGLVHIVDDIYVGSSFRPSAAALKALGLPEPGPQCWYYDPTDGSYRELTDTAAKELLTGKIVG